MPQSPALTISKPGIDLIKKWEGCKLEAYLCPAGKWTIGYGHTGTVRPSDNITQEKAEELLLKDLEWAEDCVNGLVHTPLNSNQFDALCSFVFNLGPSNFRTSTLLRYVNEYRFDQAAEEFLRWKYVDKQESVGLKKRRAEERALFLSKPNTLIV